LKQDTCYRPEISYFDENGVEHLFESSTCSYPAPVVGTHLIVYVDNNNSGNIKQVEGSTFGLWGSSLILAGLGLIFTLIGLALVCYREVIIRLLNKFES